MWVETTFIELLKTSQCEQNNSYFQGVNTPHKYIFASFPSETDVEKFWEICMEHSNIIVLIDHVKVVIIY